MNIIGSMERNVGGIIIYRRANRYLVAYDARVCPSRYLGPLPAVFNIWQNIGQLKIWLHARGWI